MKIVTHSSTVKNYRFRKKNEYAVHAMFFVRASLLIVVSPDSSGRRTEPRQVGVNYETGMYPDLSGPTKLSNRGTN
jgi:hypothetical protein